MVNECKVFQRLSKEIQEAILQRYSMYTVLLVPMTCCYVPFHIRYVHMYAG